MSQVYRCHLCGKVIDGYDATWDRVTNMDMRFPAGSLDAGQALVCCRECSERPTVEMGTSGAMGCVAVRGYAPECAREVTFED